MILEATSFADGRTYLFNEEVSIKEEQVNKCVDEVLEILKKHLPSNATYEMYEFLINEIDKKVQCKKEKDISKLQADL